MHTHELSFASHADEISPMPLTCVHAPSAQCQGVTQLRPTQLSVSDRDRMILEHMPTVQLIARKMHGRFPQHVELEELVSAGVLGLIDAVQRFDHSKEVQFKSYAQFRIRGAILDSLRVMDWSPRDLRRKGREIEEVIRSLTVANGRAPGEVEIAAEMGLALGQYQRLLGNLKGLEIGSLNMERSQETGEEELCYVPGPETDDPLFRCVQGEMRERLAAAVESLPEKERLVLTLYYYEELTMKEIALVLGVVESRVSQIRASAVVRLRSVLRGTDKPQASPAGTRNSRAQCA